MLTLGEFSTATANGRAKNRKSTAAPAAVRLTGWEHAGRGAFQIAARWGSGRPFSAPSAPSGSHDPLMLCETLRQSALLLARAAYRTPTDHYQAWNHIHYRINPHALHKGHSETEVTLYVSCADVRFMWSHPISITFHAEAVRDGDLLAVATLEVEQLSPLLYRHVRTRRRGPGPSSALAQHGTAPTEPGRRLPHGPLLAPTLEEHRWRLDVPPRHAAVPQGGDHAPPMLMLDALQRAALAMEPSGRPAVVTSLDATFFQFTEIEEPCWIEAEPEPSSRAVTVSAIQRASRTVTAVAETTLSGTHR
ncbi:MULTISPECIES: AfsA-related hotdog domain-containing protein [unclassified Streptomyces]|uniref:AfsA-related hotdog domain-containing protein n=1 Tax=unclassified Streptomyces TaxID=2593676 RepID=UPI0015E18073|nr:MULTISPECIES: AfsA-related hotdog domain-containing protein [unclassified Streptomyces]